MLHFIFLTLAAVILLLSILMRSEGPESVFLPGVRSPMPETCSSRRLLGIDCPGCGLTRSFISISRGDFARAWQLNRASFVVYLFVMIQIPWHALQLWKLRRDGRAIDWTWIYGTPIFVVIVLMINWLWKLSQLI